MNKKNEKIEKKVEVKDSNKTDIKKTSSFKKRKKQKRILPLVLLMYIQLSIIQ